MPTINAEAESDRPQHAVLTDEQRLGLSAWFVNYDKDKNVDRVCRAAQLHLWSKEVENVLDQNKLRRNPKRPTGWCQLADAVGRNREGFTNYTKSHNALSDGKTPRLPDANLRHAVAWALGLDDSDLSPTTEEWVATAALLLILKFDWDARPTDENLNIYGCYMFRIGRSRGCLSDSVIDEIANDLGVDGGAQAVRQCVLETASVVGTILLRKLGWKCEYAR